MFTAGISVSLLVCNVNRPAPVKLAGVEYTLTQGSGCSEAERTESSQ